MLFRCVSAPNPEQIPNKTINFMTKSQWTSLICSSAKQISLRWWAMQIQQIVRSIEFLWVKVKGESEYSWITLNPKDACLFPEEYNARRGFKWAGMRVRTWLRQELGLSSGTPPQARQALSSGLLYLQSWERRLVCESLACSLNHLSSCDDTELRSHPSCVYHFPGGYQYAGFNLLSPKQSGVQEKQDTAAAVSGSVSGIFCCEKCSFRRCSPWVPRALGIQAGF